MLESVLRNLAVTYPMAPATTINIMILHKGSTPLDTTMKRGMMVTVATSVMIIVALFPDT